MLKSENLKSLIKELLTRAWAGSRKTTKESAKAWASAIPRQSEGRRAEQFPESGCRGPSGEGAQQTFGRGLQSVLSATTDRGLGGVSVPILLSFSDLLAPCLGETQLETRQQGSWDVKYLGQPLGHRMDGQRLSGTK